jgi:glycosyltransferase involved in cell wall biosynthesis
LSQVARKEVKVMIDACDEAPGPAEVVGRCQGHALLPSRGQVHGIPIAAEQADLDRHEPRQQAGAIRAARAEAVQAQILSGQAAIPIEFAGWLPIYAASGNCGRHPQFTHTAHPPPGYRFTFSAPAVPRTSTARVTMVGQLRSGVSQFLGTLWAGINPFLAVWRRAPRVGLRARLRLLTAVLRLFVTLVRGGARLGAILRFLRSRHFHSQLLLAPHRGVVFLTSIPFTYGQNPWLLEIEDPTTLFFPMIQNGNTSRLHIRKSAYYPIVKALLESESCQGILTHMHSTAQLVPRLFQSETISKKVVHVPLGVPLPKTWQHHEEQGPDDPIHLLFINSWCQVPSNFYLRGGLDILEAFAILRQRFPQLRLTLRTGLPPIKPRYHRIIEAGWVRVINRFLSPREMAKLHAGSHIFLLPAARVHIVSLLQAMSYGLAVVASDGWGIEEYLNHERNGLIVKGRYGKVSWADEQSGLLRENYTPMYKADRHVVEGLVEAISRLVEDHQLRARLGRAARTDVETRFSLEQWNLGLQAAFDRLLTRGEG